jgi:hypothetical protein
MSKTGEDEESYIWDDLVVLTTGDKTTLHWQKGIIVKGGAFFRLPVTGRRISYIDFTDVSMKIIRGK